MPRWRNLLLASMLGMTCVADADIVHLESGGRIEGRIIDRTEDTVTIELGAGTMIFPLASILRIEPGRTPLDDYDERVAVLADDDVAGWLALGDWASGRNLAAQAQAAFRHVLTLDPGNAAANQALGRVQVEGQWLSREDAMLAKGYVRFEGRWLLPEQQAAIERQRREESAAVKARAEARQAEARAREAEARAREAEARVAEDQDADESAYRGYDPHWPVRPPVRPLPPDRPEPEPLKPIQRPLNR